MLHVSLSVFLFMGHFVLEISYVNKMCAVLINYIKNCEMIGMNVIE